MLNDFFGKVVIVTGVNNNKPIIIHSGSIVGTYGVESISYGTYYGGGSGLANLQSVPLKNVKFTDQDEDLINKYLKHLKSNLTGYVRHNYNTGNSITLQFKDDKGNIITELPDRLKNLGNGYLSNKDGSLTVVTLPISCLDSHYSQTFSQLAHVYRLAKAANLTVSFNNGVEQASSLTFDFGRQITNDQVRDAVIALDTIATVAYISFCGDVFKAKPVYRAHEYELTDRGFKYLGWNNAWAAHPNTMHMLIDFARKAMSLGRLGLMEEYFEYDQDYILNIINNWDVTEATSYLLANEKSYKTLINTAYGRDSATNYVFNAFVEGMGSILNNPSDLVTNWRLGGGNSFNAGILRMTSYSGKI